jgi:hypothetical protein
MMEDFEFRDTRDDVFSRVIKAGKRTYFFDVKKTRDQELYLTITESKKRFDDALGKFIYEKHKIFLYQEDFEKFTQNLEDVFSYIRTGSEPQLPDESDKNNFNH